MNKKLAVIFLFVIILSGCTGQRNKEEEIYETEQTESVSVATWEELDFDLARGATLIGDTVFYSPWEYDSESMLFKTEVIRLRQGDEVGEVILALEDWQRLIYFLVDEDESVYTLCSEPTEDGDSYFIRKDDSKGNMVYCEGVPLTLDEIRTGIWIAGPEGEVCFCTYGGAAYFFDNHGRLTGKIDFEWDGPDPELQTTGLVNAENNIYRYQVDGNMVILRAVDMENGTFGPEETISIESGGDMDNAGNMLISLFSGYGKGVLLSSDEVLWRYSPETGEIEELLHWSDKHINLKGAFVEQIGVLPDGSFYVLSYDYSTNTAYQVLIQEKGMDEVEEIKTIVIGCLSGMADVIKDSVKAFNLENTEYLAEIRIYSNSFEFHADLLRGDGPDIFDVTSMPKDMLAAKGITEDLRPYFEASDIVKESDLLPRVREAGYTEGGLEYVIPKFSLHANIVEKGYAGNYGWTGEEFLALADKYPGGSLTGDLPTSILTYTLSAEIGSYINWEEQGCSFNSGSFANLLELLKRSVRGSETAGGTLWGSMAADFHNKDILVHPVIVSGITEYLHIKTAFLDQGELIGYPNPEGKTWYRMNPAQAYSMNSASENKEGAWKFLEFLLSEKCQSDSYSFPVRSDAFESWLEKETKDLYGDAARHYFHNYYTGEVTEELPEFTDADREFIRFMVENAYWEESAQVTDIMLIIWEETEPFFAGDKTAKDVADIIQSRISLYLKE